MEPTQFGTTKGVDQRFIDSAKKRMARDTTPCSNGCVEWTGVTPKDDGYVQVRVTRSRRPYAHRLSYELSVGEIPVGMHVLHKCDNRRCVNPEHLFLGTHQENMRDRNEKGRQRACGVQRRILTPDDVRQIRELKGKRSIRRTATDYKVSDTAIKGIWSGKTWKWVT